MSMTRLPTAVAARTLAAACRATAISPYRPAQLRSIIRIPAQQSRSLRTETWRHRIRSLEQATAEPKPPSWRARVRQWFTVPPSWRPRVLRWFIVVNTIDHLLWPIFIAWLFTGKNPLEVLFGLGMNDNPKKGTTTAESTSNEERKDT